MVTNQMTNEQRHAARMAARNTMMASPRRLWAVALFGRRIILREGNAKVVLRRYRGDLYFARVTRMNGSA